MTIKLDILVFAAHPDDAELGCGGTIAHYTQLGKKVGVIDLTQGELGTRGSIETRQSEAHEASQILKLSLRENLQMSDGFFKNDKEHQLIIIEKIRQYQPDIIIGNAYHDRHPDHGRASSLITDACFLAGLTKIETHTSEAWRPRLLLHYIQDRFIKPDILFDISTSINQKTASITAYKTQFYNKESTEPQTYISQANYIDAIYARARELGKYINADYAEGFLCQKQLGVNDIFNLR